MHENQQEVQKVWFWEPIQNTGCDFMPATHWRFCHAKSHFHFFFFFFLKYSPDPNCWINDILICNEASALCWTWNQT